MASYYDREYPLFCHNVRSLETTVYGSKQTLHVYIEKTAELRGSRWSTRPLWKTDFKTWPPYHKTATDLFSGT